jgi:hypothetical protein
MKINFIEKVNIEICHKLNNISFTQFLELYENNKEDSENLKNEYLKVKNYCKKIIESNNNLKIEYEFNKNDFGRLYSNELSLQNLPSKIRGLLCDGITFDLDQKNSSIKILIKECLKNGIEYKNLKNYDENREEYLLSLMNDLNIDKKEAKQLFISCLFKEDLTLTYGNKKKKIKNNGFLNFDIETKKIINELYKIYEKDYIKYLNKNDYNLKGKLCNLIVFKIENESLLKCFQFLKVKNIQVHSLFFDGLQQYKGVYEPSFILTEINKEFKGDGIEWTYKSHNIELLEKLNNMEIKVIDSFISNNIIELGEYILNGVLKDKLIRCKNNIYYMGDYKIDDDLKEIEIKLYNFLSNQDYYIIKTLKNFNISKDHIGLKQLVESIINKTDNNDSFINDVWDYTKNKIFFNNGFWDFNLNKFILGNFNKTFKKINRDFKETNDGTDIIYEKCLNPIFSILNNDSKEDNERKELRDNFIYRLGRALGGFIEDKIWFSIQGLRNCGKGFISDLLINTFQDLISTTNSSNFILKKSSDDTAKTQNFIVDCEFKRLLLTQEISLMNGEKLDGNLIKKFNSGGDVIQARKLHCNIKEFKIQCALMMFSNDEPEIMPMDAKELCYEYQLKSKFIDEDFKEDDKIKGFHYFKKDGDIKSNFKNEIILNAFSNIIFYSFKNPIKYPKEILKDLVSTDDINDTKKLMELFEITNNENDKITNEELRFLLKANEINYTLKKVKLLLYGMGCKEYRTSNKRSIQYIKLKSLNFIDNNNCDFLEDIEII